MAIHVYATVYPVFMQNPKIDGCVNRRTIDIYRCQILYNYVGNYVVYYVVGMDGFPLEVIKLS